jgi:hypothetical protein
MSLENSYLAKHGCEKKAKNDHVGLGSIDFNIKGLHLGLRVVYEENYG